jgi:hypothetical protein
MVKMTLFPFGHVIEGRGDVIATCQDPATRVSKSSGIFCLFFFFNDVSVIHKIKEHTKRHTAVSKSNAVKHLFFLYELGDASKEAMVLDLNLSSKGRAQSMPAST